MSETKVTFEMAHDILDNVPPNTVADRVVPCKIYLPLAMLDAFCNTLDSPAVLIESMKPKTLPVTAPVGNIGTS